MSELAPGWVETTIGDVFAVVGGGTPDTTIEAYWTGTTPWISSADISGKGAISIRRRITSAGINGSAASCVPTDSVIVVTRVGLGKVARASEPIAFSQDCQALLPVSGIDPEFLRLQLSSTAQLLRYQSRGTTISGVTKKQLLDLRLLIAPAAEQERVVAAIQEQFARLDAAAAALERVQQNLKRMRAVVLQAAVRGRLVPQERTDGTGAQLAADMRMARGGKKPPARSAPKLFTAPETWGVGSLEAFTDPDRVICYGILMPRVKVGGTVPYVEVKDLRSRKLSADTLHRTSEELNAAFPRSVLSEGDVVLAIRGSYDRAHVVPSDVAGANVSRDVARIAPLPGLEPRYLAAYLMSPPALRYLRERARGVAVKGVNIADLRALPIALPPQPEQERIWSELDRINSVLNDLETSLATQYRRSATLRSAFLAAAFSGKLIPQDPTDEPASILLERIAAERESSNGNKPTRGRETRTTRTKGPA